MVIIIDEENRSIFLLLLLSDVKMADIYLPLPVDRKQMQEKKLAKLQQEIAEMEQRIQENVALRQHLESISDAENERTQRVLVSLTA